MSVDTGGAWSKTALNPSLIGMPLTQECGVHASAVCGEERSPSHRRRALTMRNLLALTSTPGRRRGPLVPEPPDPAGSAGCAGKAAQKTRPKTEPVLPAALAARAWETSPTHARAAHAKSPALLACRL